MLKSRLTQLAAVTATTILCTAAATTPAFAARRDLKPPTAPYILYAQGYHCGQLIAGWSRSTDDVTAQPQLRYEVFADGQPIGSATDDPNNQSGVWVWLQSAVLTPGQHTVTVKAQDAAGNWSASSNADAVTGYAC